MTTPTSGMGWARSPPSSTSRPRSASSVKPQLIQIHNNPGQVPAFTVAGATDLNSALLDQRQWEGLFRDGFAAEALRRRRLPALGFRALFQPRLQARPVRRPDVQRHRAMGQPDQLAAGVQGDGSWKVADDHTLRGGFLVQREHVTSYSNSQVLPVDAAGDPTSDQARRSSRAPTTSAGSTASTSRTSGRRRRRSPSISACASMR